MKDYLACASAFVGAILIGSALVTLGDMQTRTYPHNSMSTAGSEAAAIVFVLICGAIVVAGAIKLLVINEK